MSRVARRPLPVTESVSALLVNLPSASSVGSSVSWNSQASGVAGLAAVAGTYGRNVLAVARSLGRKSPFLTPVAVTCIG